MVAFLAKPTESNRFEQILDFLNANPIKYALMVNPTIYTSCIEQLWATAKLKIINGEVQLQALVDGKKVIITKISVRRDLQLEDAAGIEYVFDGKEVFIAEQSEKVVEEVVSTVEVSAAATITIKEITLAQALAELRSAKPKIVRPARTLGKEKETLCSIKSSRKEEKPPTKAQKKSTILTYLKNMAGYKQSQLKNKSFAEIQKLFDKAMIRVNMFVDKDTELVKESSKKAETEMAQESSCIESSEKLAINSIPLATKPPSNVDWKIVKEGRISLFQIIRANGSSKRYSSMIQMLRDFDREDLETLWKLVKAKHGSTRPEEGYETYYGRDL
ncbi:hypothetical protein Tco_0560640 [Tanacetum coccineum]